MLIYPMNNNQMIKIRGARVNNLKNINLDIPKFKFIVVTGVSGSGKSSLVFDTLYQEGKRKYIESLDSASRQFLGNFKKPDVDQIEGLCPSIHIEKKIMSHNIRSNVGTMTEIYDYLRLLYANISIPYHPITNEPIQNQNLEEIAEKILKFQINSKIFILAPYIEEEKGTHQKLLKKLKKDGFLNLIIDDQILSLNNNLPSLDPDKNHNIYIIIDRLEIKKDNKERLYDSLELSFSLVSDKVFIFQDPKIFKFYRNYSKIDNDLVIPKRDIKLFSFKHSYGFCTNCKGIGIKKTIDPKLIVRLDKSIKNGGIIPYFCHKELYTQIHDLKSFCKHNNINMNVPLKKLDAQSLNILLYKNKDKLSKENDNFNTLDMGVINVLEYYYNLANNKNNINWFIDLFMSQKKCNLCLGARLNQGALLFKIRNKNIYELTQLTIENLLVFFQNLKLTNEEKQISNLIFQEILNRLNFLKNIGLDYLTLNHYSKNLSGGEIQRIKLVNQISKKLSGVLYTLDNPSIGLHPKDNEKLIKSLKTIKNLGNTVLVIERDLNTILEADYVIDMGLLSGNKGGEIIAYGSPQDIMQNKQSLTGQYLSGEKIIDIPKQRNPINHHKTIKIKNIYDNNLKNINVIFPLEIFTIITGVSGSGKSTLLQKILSLGLRKQNFLEKLENKKNILLNKYNNIPKIIKIIPSSLGKQNKSNLAAYTKIFDNIKNLLSRTTEAKIKGYAKNHFSFNNIKGRCEYCSGQGMKKKNMYFLPDVFIKCKKCNGQKFNKEILQIKYKDKNIADILNMTVEEAFLFFANFPIIKFQLKILKEIGLEHIILGQEFTTISDGEFQRIQLAYELAKQKNRNTIYILDEPTIGLHSEDVKKLIDIIHYIIKNQKVTVIMIEHNLDVIKNADYIIDLGPQGGPNGGYIMAEGTPEEISRNPQSYTGQYLKKILNLK